MYIFYFLYIFLFLELTYSVDIVDEEPHFVGYAAINNNNYYFYYYYFQSGDQERAYSWKLEFFFLISRKYFLSLNRDDTNPNPNPE